MKISTFTSRALLFGAALCVQSVISAQDTTAMAIKTVPNLKSAYQGETTAHDKYIVYARVADKQGYKYVAQLFRAASAAEKIHASNHKQVLASLGVLDPVAGKYSVQPGSTKENLTDALGGESYERDTMYPDMIRQAKSEGQPNAERSMTYALSAEKQHAALYTAALKNLSAHPVSSGLYVCPACGATYTIKNVPSACPVCNTSKSKFNLVK